MGAWWGARRLLRGGFSWALVCTLLWTHLGLASLVLDRGPNCNAKQYKLSDRCCSKCPPGQKVTAVCPGDSSGDTACAPCEEGSFQAEWTQEQECTPHRACSENAGLEVYTPGTTMSQAECRCRRGTHCSSHECHTCRHNTPCGPGQGVKQQATHEQDTVCADCPSGSFSNVSSATDPCQPWSSCEAQNLVQKEKGTPLSDVVCGSLPPLTQKDTERTHLLAFLPLMALLLLGGFFAVCYWLRRRGLQKQQPQQQQHNQDPLQLEGQDPREIDDLEECPALPIQETLLGTKPAQEEGKESRLAVQEQV
ncbi:tumor necrosis factor receptor superfamily member 5 [Anolis carolinensis]|uniref:tumor necrosis factor receptor superfamily member 5 n=1 Tax=Anolis carolinensis TaxID=28377 RepID=UPI002F2B6C41